MSTIKVLRNSIIYSLGNIVQKSYNLFIALVVSRFLTTEEFGKLAIITLLGSFVSMTVISAVSGSVMRFYVDLEGEERRKFIGSMIIFIQALSFLIIFAVAINGQNLIHLFFPNSNIAFYPFFFIGLLIVFFTMPYTVVNSVFRIKEEPRRVFQIQSFHLLLNVSLITIFLVFLRRTVIGVLEGQLLAAVVLFVLYFYFLRGELVLSFSWSLMKPALKFSLPLLPYIFLSFLRDSSDRFFLEKYVSLSDIGIYSIGLMLGMGIGIVVSGLAASYSPRMFNLIKEKGAAKAKEEFAHMAVHIFFIMFVSFALVAIFAKEVFFFIVQKSYQAGYSVTPLVAFAFFLRGVYLFFHNSFYWTKKTHYVSWITLWSTIATALGMISFIPRFGIMGAGYGIIIGQVVALALAYVWGQKVFPIKYDFGKFILVSSIGISLIFSLIYFVDYPVSLYIFLLKTIAFATILLLGWYAKIIRPNQIKSFFQLILKKDIGFIEA